LFTADNINNNDHLNANVSQCKHCSKMDEYEICWWGCVYASTH